MYPQWTRRFILLIAVVFILALPFGSASAQVSQVTITSPNDDADLAGSITITGVAPDDTTLVELSTDNGATWIPVEGTATWQHQWDTISLTDGAYTLLARSTASDASQTTSQPTNVMVDNTAPVILWETPRPGMLIRDDFYFSGYATDGAGSGIVETQYSTDNGVTWTVAEGSNAPASWQFVMDTRPFPNGPLTLLIRGVDQAGNTSLPDTRTFKVGNYSEWFTINPGDNQHSAGDSALGPDEIVRYLEVHPSNGNDVVYIQSYVSPSAYGGNNREIMNNPNGCVPKGFGIADVGIPGQDLDSKNHEYTFTFTEGVTTDHFELTLVDWGDFLRYAAPNATVGTVMVAYDLNDNIVDMDYLIFATTGSGANNRMTQEWGSLAVSGDACTAAYGTKPGAYTYTVQGGGIARVEFRFSTVIDPDSPDFLVTDRGSMDPNVAIADVLFHIDNIEEPTPTPPPTGTPLPTETPRPTQPPTTPVPTTPAPTAPAGSLSTNEATLVKSVATPYQTVGETLVWTLTVKNTGTTTLQNLRVVDPVPDHLSITAVHAALPYEVTDNIVIFYVPSLDPGGSMTFTIDTVTTDASPAGELCNTAHLNDDEPKPSSIACIALYPNELPTTGGKGIPEGGMMNVLQWFYHLVTEYHATLHILRGLLLRTRLPLAYQAGMR